MTDPSSMSLCCSNYINWCANKCLFQILFFFSFLLRWKSFSCGKIKALEDQLSFLGVSRHSKQHQCCHECCHGKYLHMERSALGMESWILILPGSKILGGNVGMNGVFSRISHSPSACWIYLRREVTTRVKIYLVLKVFYQGLDRHKNSFHVDHQHC